MTRLSSAFTKPHPTLATFVTAGDGDTAANLDALVAGGADMIANATRYCEEPEAPRQSSFGVEASCNHWNWIASPAARNDARAED
jgi:hypothetical protein